MKNKIYSVIIGIFAFMLVFSLFTRAVSAATKSYSVKFHSSSVSGWSNRKNFTTSKNGTVSLRASYYMGAASPKSISHHRSPRVSLHYRCGNFDLRECKVGTTKTIVSNISLPASSKSGPSKSGRVSWTGVPKNDKYYFITRNESGTVAGVYINGSGSYTYP